MRSVWTFWTKPFDAHYRRFWKSPKHHLLSWILSVETGRVHYPRSSLFTDDAGARMLVDSLGLPFERVSTDLNELDVQGQDPEWWVLGKLHTYRAQQSPFIHLDSDVFLWKPLPLTMESAPVIAQNPESFAFEDMTLYRPAAFISTLRSVQGWLPPELLWYAALRGTTAICCGLLGGTRVDFLQHYAELATEVIRHPRNQAAWPLLGIRDNILVEQYFLSACIEYHRNVQRSSFTAVHPEYLFRSSEEAFDEDHAAALGYTHLIGDAKQNTDILDRLERRVQRDYPHYYERCLDYLGGRAREQRLPPMSAVAHEVTTDLFPNSITRSLSKSKGPDSSFRDEFNRN